MMAACMVTAATMSRPQMQERMPVTADSIVPDSVKPEAFAADSGTSRNPRLDSMLRAERAAAERRPVTGADGQSRKIGRAHV